MNAYPSTQNRPYQGYPYVNPIAIDAPSINAADAAKWQDLPRKPVAPSTPAASTSKDTETITKLSPPDRQKLEDRPVIYIDIPEDENQPNTQASPEINADERPPSPHRKDSNGGPVVYIDIPEIEEDRDTEETSTNETNQSSTDFVEETIYYDPFEDRRIDVNRSEGSTSRNGASTPERPSRLVLPSYSAEGTSEDIQSPQSSVPHFMSKETYIYSQPSSSPGGDDGLRLSPLPVSSLPEYPDPPPAYTEVDTTRQPELPRTQVNVPENSQINATNSGRKLILCPYCGRRVLTLVIRENGILTHVLGIIFLFACFPVTVCVYCTDCCKYLNHYCPQCNQLIAYEVPILCQNMVYNKV